MIFCHSWKTDWKPHLLLKRWVNLERFGENLSREGHKVDSVNGESVISDRRAWKARLLNYLRHFNIMTIIERKEIRICPRLQLKTLNINHVKSNSLEIQCKMSPVRLSISSWPHPSFLIVSATSAAMRSPVR